MWWVCCLLRKRSGSVMQEKKRCFVCLETKDHLLWEIAPSKCLLPKFSYINLLLPVILSESICLYLQIAQAICSWDAVKKVLSGSGHKTSLGNVEVVLLETISHVKSINRACNTFDQYARYSIFQITLHREQSYVLIIVLHITVEYNIARKYPFIAIVKK